MDLPSNPKPCIAILDANTLMCMGLKAVLEKLGTFVDVKIYDSFEHLLNETPEYPIVHYFISSRMLLEHFAYFQERQKKTIVFTSEPQALQGKIPFRMLDVSQSEPDLIKSLLHIHQMAHSHGYPAIDAHGTPLGHGCMLKTDPQMPLSLREVEVLVLLVRGCINKEIAERLNIGLTTVISHRKNIIEKLGMKSISALTIYAVTHGYIDVDNI